MADCGIAAACGQSLASCICGVAGDHSVHRCSCGGAWKGTTPCPPSEIEVVLYPGGLTFHEAFAAMLGVDG